MTVVRRSMYYLNENSVNLFLIYMAVNIIQIRV